MSTQTSKNTRNYFEWKNEGYPLFEQLKSKPTWWVKLTENYPDDIYINIRKDGHLNVYTQGGSLMELSCPDRNNIVAKIHKFYLGEEYEKGNEYRYDLTPEFIVSQIDEILGRIHSDAKFSGEKDNSQEGCAEKFIQSQMFIKRTAGRFIDTEFAEMRILSDEEFNKRLEDHKKKGGKTGNVSHYKQVRIDLVEILEDGRIQFVELKRISDSRLNSKDKKPHIIKQMEEYQNLIGRYSDAEIVHYYSNVLKTLIDIGACPKDLISAQITGVSRDVRLYFFNYKKELKGQPGKARRIKEIKEILEREQITSNIEQIDEDYNS